MLKAIRVLVLIFSWLLILTSCKKSPEEPTPEEDNSIKAIGTYNGPDIDENIWSDFQLILESPLFIKL